MIQMRATLSKKSDLAGAIHYALSRWRALTRYCEDAGAPGTRTDLKSEVACIDWCNKQEYARLNRHANQ
jgi:hypothetical protein